MKPTILQYAAAYALVILVLMFGTASGALAFWIVATVARSWFHTGPSLLLEVIELAAFFVSFRFGTRVSHAGLRVLLHLTKQ